jgi:hypothetical protein
VIFNINKKSNSLKIGGGNKWISSVDIGGAALDLYGKDFISLLTSVTVGRYLQFM